MGFDQSGGWSIAWLTPMGASAGRAGSSGYPQVDMAIIHVHGADLMMYSRVETQLEPLGHRVQRARPGLEGDAPDVCICDVERVAPEQAVADLRPAKLLGFGSHEQPDALRAARRAGFDRVVARSAIADRLAALVDELMI
jgi:hypothetical protein